MQLKRKPLHIVSGCVLLLGGIALLMSARAQAPQQAQIAFVSRRDGNNEIYVMGTDGKEPHNLTNHPAADRYPDWFDPGFAPPVTPVSTVGKLRGTWGWIKR